MTNMKIQSFKLINLFIISTTLFFIHSNYFQIFFFFKLLQFRYSNKKAKVFNKKKLNKCRRGKKEKKKIWAALLFKIFLA